MSNTFFISDTHFHHKNILKYEPCRVAALAEYLHNEDPTQSIDELVVSINNAIAANDCEYFLMRHDDMIVEHWNKAVKPSDTVWFLGDFALCKQDHAIELCNRLNGRKRMVRGNHDKWPDEVYRRMGFEYVSKYPVILKTKFILSHAPINTTGTPFFNIYGHVHSHENFATATAASRCVCVERQNFTPITIHEFDMYQPPEPTNPAEERNR